MNESKKNAEILANWYQSYYFWNSAAYANSFLNTNNFNYPNESSKFINIQKISRRQEPLIPQPVRRAEPQLQRVIVRTEAPIYRVPTLLRRFLAEIIDAFYIQVLKIIIALVLINYTNLVNEDSFKIYEFFEDILNEENITNIRLPMELLMLEFTYVLISVLFESFCLYKRGYTPGKYLLNLKVVSCSQINALLLPRHVHVVPGTKLGLKSIILRTCLKNFSIVFLFPTIVFFLLPAFIDYGQTSYDKASESIVVQNIN